MWQRNLLTSCVNRTCNRPMLHYPRSMTELQHAAKATRPRIQPAEEGDRRPLSVSARLGRLQFHQSGKFRVLQFADIQDGPKVSKDTISLIEASLDATRPDLVIFNGNQIAGYALANAKRWGVLHVIWRQGFYPGIGAPSWTADYGNETANHFDHVHIATSGGGYPTGSETYYLNSMDPTPRN